MPVIVYRLFKVVCFCAPRLVFDKSIDTFSLDSNVQKKERDVICDITVSVDVIEAESRSTFNISGQQSHTAHTSLQPGKTYNN